MERHNSRTIAPTTVCRELLSNCNSDEMAGIVVGDARSAAPTRSGLSTSDRGRGIAPTSDSVQQDLSEFSAPLDDQLRAIRRKLWIFNTTLNSLPAKIQMACRQSGEWVETEVLDRSVHTCDGLAKGGVALKSKKVLSYSPADWKCARLRARAIRAERHAAVAMNNASASLRDAFEAVLQYACARAQADDYCRNINRTPTPPGCS